MKRKTRTQSPSAGSAAKSPAKPRPKQPGPTAGKVVVRGRNWSKRVGERAGRLTVLGIHGKTVRGALMLLCQCDCGTQTKVQAGNLGRATRSCGCLSKEMRKTCSLKHGHKSGGKVSKLYRAWQSMKTRCYGHQKINHHYVENNIQVCDEWLNGDGLFSGFECFAAYMKEPPSPVHTVERKNNLGNYEPGNVSWDTRRVQSNNKSNNRYVEAHGRRLTIMQWSRISGIGESCIRLRLNRGWGDEDAVSLPASRTYYKNRV